MFFKSRAPEKDKNAAANAPEVMGSMAQQQHSVVEQVAAGAPVPKAGPASCIGSSMSIVGNIKCNGLAQVFGRIEGELCASDLLIGNGAQVEGSVIAQDVTVCGRVKGTIKDPQRNDMQNPAPAPLPSIDADLQRVERWFVQSRAQMAS